MSKKTIVKDISSQYRVTWIEFIPYKGCVPVHDRKIFGDVLLVGRRLKTYRKPFADEATALRYLQKMDMHNVKLQKNYTCYIFTDAQYVMTRGDNDAIPYTKEQLAHPYYL